MLDQPTHDALNAFKHRLVSRYGKRLRGIFLFGSRARGNHRPDSDVDVAVFIDGVDDPLSEQLALVDEGYPILLDTGLYIQPWVFAGDALLRPQRQGDDAQLLEAIRREGVRV